VVQKISGGRTKIGAAQLGNGLSLQAKKLPISDRGASEVDTGFDLPAKAIVLDCWVDIRTLEGTASTKTIDVGLLSSESGGDADGFLDGVSTAAAVSVQGTLTNGTLTLGALLRDASGVSVAYSRKNHLADSVAAKSVSYTLGEAHTEVVGDIHILYAVLR
jgi:hypothetical protein